MPAALTLTTASLVLTLLLTGGIVFLLVYVVAALVAAIAGMLGFIVLIVGALITIPFATLWQYLVQAHLFGQIAKNSVTPAA